MKGKKIIRWLPRPICGTLALLVAGCVTIQDITPDPATAGGNVTVQMSNVIGPAFLEPGATVRFDGTVMPTNPNTSSTAGFVVPPATPPGTYTVDINDPPGLLEIITIVLLFRDRTDSAPLQVGGAAPALNWVPNGPGPNTQGQVEGNTITNLEVVGAIQAVTPHPTDATVLYVGAVNGGIWRSGNALAASPTWTQQTDNAQSLSIGALEFDPTDANNQTLVAGIGRFSSLGRRGGALTGLLRTTDGSTWTPINPGGALTNLNIAGVAPRGNTIVLAENAGGIWRSTNLGANWTQISGAAGTGLPAGAAFDLASDPNNAAVLYTNAGGSGVYRSNDTGATWTLVSTPAMNALINPSENVQIAVGTANNVYVAIATEVVLNRERLTGLFRSGDGGGNWTALDLPTTTEVVGTPGIHPGGQGDIHLSIAADPNDPNVVYIGGDRQPCQREATNCRPLPQFPNSIGANDFSGRLFRVDASQPAGSQAVALTHNGTTSGSAPHADSRDMDVAPDGSVVESDDGGVYRRTNPLAGAGDWFSLNGDIQTTEFHQIAWDASADIIIGGAQDTGVPQQNVTAGPTWLSVRTADGGDVAVDDTGTPGLSVRYSSTQFLGNFRRQTFDAANNLQSNIAVALNAGLAVAVNPQFYTPIAINNVNPNRLVILARNRVYESFDQGANVTIVPAPVLNLNANSFPNDPIAYGGAGNPDMLYMGWFNQVWVRNAAPPAALTQSATYTGGNVVDIAIDPTTPNTAFVVDQNQVFQTADGGGTWTDVTGNLGGLNVGAIHSVAFRGGASGDAVAIGTDTGVYLAPAPFNVWAQYGIGLPRAPVQDLDYDAGDRVFVAGTQGRGAWVLQEP